MVIYDYANNEKQIELPNKPIKKISVIILSGDELVTVEFEDGEITEEFDSSSHRLISYYDYFYIVVGKAIEEWLSFKPNEEKGIPFSYQRRAKFVLFEE